MAVVQVFENLSLHEITALPRAQSTAQGSDPRKVIRRGPLRWLSKPSPKVLRKDC